MILALAAQRRAGVILMHRLRTPDADSFSDRYQTPPIYEGGVVHAVRRALSERLDAARAAGIPEDAVVLDPGLGFGKTVGQNLALIRATPELLALGRPLLGGVSRKSFVARAQDLSRPDTDPAPPIPGPPFPAPPGDRLEGSLALSVVQLTLGVRLFRVHDVRAHRRALDAAWAACIADLAL